MDIIENLNTPHLRYFLIHKIKTIPLGSQPDISIRILFRERRIQTAFLRHSCYFHIAYLSCIRRKNRLMHARHKEQDIPIAQFSQFGFIIKIRIGNMDDFRLGFTKLKPQKTPLFTTYIQMVSNL